MVPPADGLADVVRRYCGAKVAVYVVGAAGAVTVWLAGPLSDQLPNTYCVPAAPACVAAAIVCVVPGVHCKAHGAVQFVPSTASVKPEGALAIVTAVGAVKAAVTEAAALIVTFCGVVVPVKAPLN